MLPFMSLSTAARVMLPALVLLVTMALVSPSKTCLQQVEEKSHLQSPSSVAFTDVAGAAGINALQCEIRTSPNCLFPQWDKTLKRWDQGGFCMEETLTGGACIGDFDSDGIDDLYYPRMDGADILYANRGDGTFVDVTERSGLSSLAEPAIPFKFLMEGQRLFRAGSHCKRSIS